MTKQFCVLVTLAAIGLCASGSQAIGSTIAEAEAVASGTAVTLDSNPVVTAILSQPGTVNGRTYSNWSIMVDDGTGSLLVFGSSIDGYTNPTLGDAVSVTGKYLPFHQIPELGTVTAMSLVSTGNPVPAPIIATIPELNVATLPMSLAGHLITVKGVTVSGEGTGNWGTSNSPSGAMITDTGGNSMTLFYWPTSYSLSNANMANTAIPAGPVDMTGIVSVFNGVAEFSPMSVTPEPATLIVLALGGLVLTRCRARA